jgi:hypothetical protein
LDDEEGPVEIFRPMIEKFGPHKMKKCSIIIRRVRYIEDVVLGGYKSIDVGKRLNGYNLRMMK